MSTSAFVQKVQAVQSLRSVQIVVKRLSYQSATVRLLYLDVNFKLKAAADKDAAVSASGLRMLGISLAIDLLRPLPARIVVPTVNVMATPHERMIHGRSK